jgi:hypothetical protein
MPQTALRPPGTLGQKSGSGSSSNNNFANALLETGGRSVPSVIDGGIQLANDVLASVIGSGSDNIPTHASDDQTDRFSDQHQETIFSQEQREKELHAHDMLMQRHREVQETKVFDRREVEEDQTIQQLIEALGQLAQSVGDDSAESRTARISIMKAGMGEKKGTGFKHFLLQLINFVQLTVKHIRSSDTWLVEFNKRGRRKNGFIDALNAGNMMLAGSTESSITRSVG